MDFATTNLTAVAGTDYTATNGTLSFTNGVTHLTITLSINADNLDEGDETLRVVLSNPVDATITTSLRTNTVTITDDDGSTVAFVSDRSGEEQVWLVDHLGRTEPTVLTPAASARLVSLAWSPDGASLAYGDKDGVLRTIDLATKTVTVCADDPRS